MKILLLMFLLCLLSACQKIERYAYCFKSNGNPTQCEQKPHWCQSNNDNVCLPKSETIIDFKTCSKWCYFISNKCDLTLNLKSNCTYRNSAYLTTNGYILNKRKSAYSPKLDFQKYEQRQGSFLKKEFYNNLTSEEKRILCAPIDMNGQKEETSYCILTWNKKLQKSQCAPFEEACKNCLMDTSKNICKTIN